MPHNHKHVLATFHNASKNEVLKPLHIDLSPLASGFSIKSIISGHGHEGPNYCCEWVSKSHYFIINESKEHSWKVWKDCGNNPIYNCKVSQDI